MASQHVAQSGSRRPGPRRASHTGHNAGKTRSSAATAQPCIDEDYRELEGRSVFQRSHREHRSCHIGAEAPQLDEWIARGH